MSKLKIIKGSTYEDVLQWATEECRYVQGTLTATAPVVVQSVGHGLVNDWIVTVDGHPNISSSDEYRIKVIDADNLSLCINGVPFGSSRQVVIKTQEPVDMAGYTSRMQIRDKKGGALLLELTTENGGITIDNASKKITRTIDAAATAAIAFKKGVYDHEMVNGAYVIKIDSGEVEVEGEVTT